MDSKLPAEPTFDEVGTLTREIGLFTATWEPTPTPVAFLVAYACLFQAHCEFLKISPETVLKYVNLRFTVTPMTDEELKRKIGN